MERDDSLMPKSRPMLISAAEMPDVLALRPDAKSIRPFDGWLEAMYAAYAFLRWACDAPHMEEAPEELGDPYEAAGPVEVKWIDDLPGGRHAAAINHLGHWVLLVIESRLEGDRTPLRYDVDSALAAKVDSICCVYLQRDHDGTVGLVLDGWIDATRVSGAGRGATALADFELEPIHRLWQQIARPAMRIRTFELPERPHVESLVLKPRQSWRIWASVTAAAAVLVLALVLPQYLGGRGGATAIDIRVAPVDVRGTPSAGMVITGAEQFRLNVHAATPLRYGWLYHFGPDGAKLLGELKQERDGALGVQHAMAFEAGKDIGWNHFVVVLTDRTALQDPAVSWMTATDRQALLSACNEEEAKEILRRAAMNAGAGEAVKVRAITVEHR